ncbi:RNA polymerase II elongation factor Ell isoform X3 [Nasonia vitripennis]|uniref:OCEL domain-containing protein n=1 Tax=Nasonia vitripennis TaxID=7425 RepID=A0A7M7T8A3_NASVI|nr:RNA polymerase II elongation factor Ell isoform X3 [Nasonia vitripennis]
MAALVAGVQYGLSSHSNFHENKSLIFVKLTDSAQRAIEDYLRNRGKINQNPTIQFLGNEGKLSFPSTKSSHGNFTFSLSSNQDIEGPQGGFECVQQTGPKNLQSLGTLPCKMRIQANDDVYETTRHRMHVAEENNKNKCTRVIKANEPIGRKVKVKGSVRAVPPSSNTTLGIMPKHREPSVLTTSNQTFKSTPSQKTVLNHLPAHRSPTETQKKLTDVMRRPLKERLIHLLALRPFKRPELYDRITREGIREKEKNVIATVLKQIAFMRDNTYHLHRCVWNDVQEDWPFYTDQEKAMLKRRKPQNLTPPGSSDGGSSGSGQSPNSTHPGSPSTIAAPPSTLLGPKRPGYYQGNDGLPTKRQRISHYRKPDSVYASNVDNTRSNVSSSIGSCLDKKQQRPQKFQHQPQIQSHLQQPNSYVSIKSDLISSSDSDDVNTKIVNKIIKPLDLPPTTTPSHIVHNQSNPSDYQYLQPKPQQEKRLYHDLPKDNKQSIKNIEDENSDTSLIEFETINVGNVNAPIHISTETITPDAQVDKEKEMEQYSESEMCLPFESSSNDKSLNNLANSTVEENFLSFSTSSCNQISRVPSESFQNTENPDYLTCYTKISSAEQRTRYKVDFYAGFKEYRKLLVQVVKIKEQFIQLEEELKNKQNTGNIEGIEAIEHQIRQEYAKRKSVYARYYYLHDKLGHIKKLVSDYDAQIDATSVSNLKTYSMFC